MSSGAARHARRRQRRRQGVRQGPHDVCVVEPIDPALLVSEPPPTAPLVVEVPFCATPSLGRKQCAVRWVPQADALAIAGSWDEPENELTAWRVRLDSVATDDARAMDDDAEERGPQTTRLGSTPHDGCVLGLAVAESGGLAFTASGAGGVSCYAIADADESVAGGKVKMDNLWSRRGAPEDRLATLGVACNGDKVAAVGEDGGDDGDHGRFHRRAIPPRLPPVYLRPREAPRRPGGGGAGHRNLSGGAAAGRSASARR